MRFKEMDPRKKYTQWSVGEPCVAFSRRRRPYRAAVRRDDRERGACLVCFVDYGILEWCPYENLCKCIPLYEIPTQAHKCSLSRLSTGETEWESKTVDFIYDRIVGLKCMIKIVGQPVADVTPIEIKHRKGMWLSDLLVLHNMAAYENDNAAMKNI